MLDPVACWSEISAKRELRARPEDQLLRETRRVHRGERADVGEIGDEVTVGDGIDAVAERARQIELARDRRRIDRIRHARERAGTERRHRRALARLVHAHPVAPQRLDVREQVVRERDRLRALQVRVSRHHRVDLGRSPLDESPREREQRAVETVQQLDDEQAQVQRDLVVAAAAGVQLSADGAGALGQHALDRRMHVLRIGGPREGPVRDLGRDALELAHERGGLVLRDDALTPQHPRVRDAAAHVVRRRGACRARATR